MNLDDAIREVRGTAENRPCVVERLALARSHGRVLAQTPAGLGEGGGPASASRPAGGVPLTPLRVARLAAAGRADVEVVRRPTVAVFTVGSAVEPGMPDVSGTGFDHARDLLVGLLRADGYEPTAWPRLVSDPRQVEIALRDAGCAFDCIVVCGDAQALALAGQVLAGFGTSRFNAVESGLLRCDAVFGVLDEACLLGLPVEPVALAGIYLTLGRALLDGLQRRSDARPDWHGVLVDATDEAMFQFARIECSATGQLSLLPLAGGGPGEHGLPRGANAVLVHPGGPDRQRAGDSARVIPLSAT